MTGQVQWRVELVGGRMGPCASMAACAGKDLGVDTHRFTVYEDQILKAIDDLSVLLKPTSTVNEQVSCVALH